MSGFSAQSMPQLIVDPNNRGNPVGEKSVAQLPRQTRKFGFIPDLERCLPGDLILFWSVSVSRTDRVITAAQANEGFADEHCRWTHAAVYLYDDLIVEAMPWLGVHTRSVYADVPDSRLRVRRRPNLDIEERYRIALCALRMLGARYGLIAVLNLGLRALAAQMWRRPWFLRKKRAIICSQVFYDAHATVTRHFLTGCDSYPLYPAHLSSTPDLIDVDVPWLKVI